MTDLLAISGSTRWASLNTQLLRCASRLAEQEGAAVTQIDLRSFPMPLYDGDLEEESGVPESVKRVRNLMMAHDGLLLACPEYNGSITPLLKNTIDWCSRPDRDDQGGVAYRGKVAGLVSASPGALGGLRGLVHVRAILNGVGMHVVPAQFALGGAHNSFDDHGAIKDEGRLQQLRTMIRQLVDTARRLAVKD